MLVFNVRGAFDGVGAVFHQKIVIVVKVMRLRSFNVRSKIPQSKESRLQSLKLAPIIANPLTLSSNSFIFSIKNLS